jgi:hypothetical protein
VATSQGIINVIVQKVLHVTPPDISFAYQIVAAPICSVVFSSINEELIYRKIIFGYLDEKKGFWYGAIVSSVLFMFSHANYAAWPSYFVVAMIWCWVYKRSGTIAVNIISHIAMNVAFFIGFSLHH